MYLSTSCQEPSHPGDDRSRTSHRLPPRQSAALTLWPGSKPDNTGRFPEPRFVWRWLPSILTAIVMLALTVEVIFERVVP